MADEDSTTAVPGRHVWAIAEGYIPGQGAEGDPALQSHETICVLNAGPREARLELRLYFSDRPPAGPYRFTVPAQRTLHLRFNDLREPQPVPRDTDYSSVLVSSEPVVVQHSRLDSRRGSLALLTTIAYSQ